MNEDAEEKIIEETPKPAAEIKAAQPQKPQGGLLKRLLVTKRRETLIAVTGVVFVVALLVVLFAHHKPAPPPQAPKKSSSLPTAQSLQINQPSDLDTTKKVLNAQVSDDKAAEQQLQAQAR
ncbi:MAG: hypothetical protein WDN27_01835 [Candidatus Saccharibacteria bacterium]